jgi:hypothetical protein
MDGGVQTWILLVILALAFVPFYGHVYRVIKADQLRKNGPVVEGEIAEVRETGTRTRQDFDVEVTVRYLNAGQTRTGTFVESITPFELQKLQVGAKVKVHFDPDAPSRLARAKP